MTYEELLAHIPKPEPVEFDMSTLTFPQYYLSREDIREENERIRNEERNIRSRRTKFSYEKKKLPLQIKSPSKEFEIPNVPEVAKVPKTDYAYVIHLTQQPKIDLFVRDIDQVRGLPNTGKLLERLEFIYQGGHGRTWPIERILEQDYGILKAIFLKMSNATGFSQTAMRMIMAKLEEISRDWNTSQNLPKRISLPYTSSKVHMDPYWLMESRDNQGTRRFFRIKDHALLRLTLIP